MGRLFSNLVVVIIISIAMLMFGGAVVDTVQPHAYRYSFFNYRIHALDDLPYWFLACLILIAYNGLQFPEYARYIGNTEFSPFRQNGRVSWNIPLQVGLLFGRNLVMVCGLLALFLIVRSARL